MQYMLLIYVPSDGSEQAESSAWMRYTQELQEAGVMVAGDGLQGLDTAQTVRVRDGGTVVTDGPFAETKEMLGGYYLIDVPDLDAALAWAAKIPSVGFGSVEVRPVMVFDAVEAEARHEVHVPALRPQGDPGRPERPRLAGGLDGLRPRADRGPACTWATTRSRGWRPPRPCACATARPSVTDGPFAETQGAARRLLHGRRAPTSTRPSRRPRSMPERRYGSVEVRPIMESG